MISRGARTLGTGLLIFGLGACASSATPEPSETIAAEQPVPQPPAADLTPHQHVQTLNLLRPPEAAVRAADRVELSGTEMGTMWTFENPPLEYWEETYGFRPDADWLAHARLASLRYGRGCSASFVSPDGLVITNNHCARGCIDATSTPESDYLTEGFYAATREEEKLCPGLFLDQLIEIEDVTSEMLTAVPEGATEAEVATARSARSSEIRDRCEEESGLNCQVVSLFHGGQFQLYKYRRYAPVKLVFTPELQAAFFGGDPDNFTFPRYDLDVSFVRAYEPDGVTPASTPDYFAWDPDGAEEGELVFVTGNPGSTSRQIAVSEYLYEQQVRHPLLADAFDARLEVLHAIVAADPARGRAMENLIFGLENSQKLYHGELAGLRDTLLMAKKIKWEKTFRSRVGTDPDLQARFGDVWDRLDAIQAQKVQLYPRLLLNNPNFLAPSAHLQLAGGLVQYVRQMARPEAERADSYRGKSLAQIEARLRSPGSLEEDLSVGMLAGRLDLARRWLPAGDSLRRAMRPGEAPQDAARRLISTSRVGEPEFRTGLMEGDAESLAAADDPLVRLAGEMLDARDIVRREWESVRSAEAAQDERFAAALFAVFGTDLPPDATFTLRISDGVVKRYPYNGTYAPAQTVFYGLYARATEFGNEMPWTLAPSFQEHRADLDMSVPINFVSTNDITGGNSGSPVIDREGRIVGVAFDGNVEAFPNEFLFAAENGRAVSVHTAGITEALHNVYRATALLEELRGR